MTGVGQENHIQLETMHHQGATKNNYPSTTQSRSQAGGNIYGKNRSTAMMVGSNQQLMPSTTQNKSSLL
jgi:hypothetical protein